MKAFTFQAPPNILFEAGASSKLAETVADYGVERVLLVTDKGVRNAGLTKGAEASLAANGCVLTVFDEVRAWEHELAVLAERMGDPALVERTDEYSAVLERYADLQARFEHAIVAFEREYMGILLRVVL